MSNGQERGVWLKCDKCGEEIEILPILSSSKINNKYLKLYCEKCREQNEKVR